MKQSTGVMVSFTLGVAAGLYVTSEEVRGYVNKRIKRPKRFIIEGRSESDELPWNQNWRECL
jgi:hypothetical protein